MADYNRATGAAREGLKMEIDTLSFFCGFITGVIVMIVIPIYKKWYDE